jgi:hypothetical protein
MYDANAIAYVRRRTRDTETGAAYNPPWIDALANVRHLACREGWRYHHVQANIVAIDQSAESALGNRQYFLNRPHSLNGGRGDDIP